MGSQEENITRAGQMRMRTVLTMVAIVLPNAFPAHAATPIRRSTATYDRPDQAKLNALLETLRTRPPSLPVPMEIEQSRDQKVRDEYFAARRRVFEEHDAKINGAVEELAAMGDDIVDWLLRAYRAPVRAPCHQIIVVLARIGTPKAGNALLGIATVPYNPHQTSYSSWAARNFVKIARDKETIRQLLKSDDPDVISIALQHLPGVSIDSTLLGSLRGYLQSTEYHPVMNYAVRAKAAAVLAGDGNLDWTAEKVAAIVGSIRTVDDMPKADEKFQSDLAGTFADHTYASLIEALVRIRGATPFLLEAKERMAGRPRAAVVVALALRGEPSVKKELCHMLRDPQMVSMTNMRWQATRALGDIGTRDDISFLERLAREDPLEIISFHGPIFEMVNGQYVNTGSRMAPIREESDPAWQTARRRFSIREAAREAMQTIEQRRLK